MLALGFGGRVMLVDDESGVVKWAAHAGSQQVQLAMSTDGRFVASTSFVHAYWTLFDAASGLVARVGDSHDGTGSCICQVPESESRLLWEPLEGCPVVAHVCSSTGRGILSLAFSPCGLRLATGGVDGVVIVWSVRSGKAEQCMIEDDSEGVSAISFSLDGSRLVSGSVEGHFCLWDTSSGALLFRLHEDFPNEVKTLHFSPTDNNQLVSAVEGEVALWNVETRAMMRRSDERGRFAVFSPNGRTIATVNGQGARDVHLVDAETGALRSTLRGHQQVVFCAAFSVNPHPQPPTPSPKP